MTSPLWTPKHPETSNLWQFMRFVANTQHTQFTDYIILHRWSIENPALFWQALCDFFKITFDTPATSVLNEYSHMIDAQWFTGAQCNFAEKLLTRNDDHPALVSMDELGRREVLTYKTLRDQVSQCAAGLLKAGIKPGDRIAAVMPNVAFTVVAMLATASMGAIWSSCSPDFGSTTIIDRLGQIEPSVLFICDGHDYNGKTCDAKTKIQDISTMLPSLKHIVVYPNIHSNLDVQNIPKAMTLIDFLEPTSELTFTSLPFAHPLYILFSSGTTGKPKCIIHGAGGTLLQHIKELGLHTDITPQDNLLFYTTCGWMMWNWMVSTLALGATLTLYEGCPTYPNAMHLFQIINDEQVTMFGTGAKFISCIEKENIHPQQHYPMQSLRTILSTGSPLLPHNYEYVYKHIKADVQLSSISGGTDIISCFALGNPILPVYSGEVQCLGLGMSVEIYDDAGRSIQNAQGELVCTKPFPSMPIGFWHDENHKRYRGTYFERFPGIWMHGDFAKITPHHGLIIYGRSDATLNPGGVRIGTAEIYLQLEKIPEIMDSVVIGQDYQDDVRVILFVKLCSECTLDETLKTTIRQTIRNNASPRHVPSVILQVADIPRTINGKLVEIAVRQTVHGESVRNLDSLANPESLAYFRNRSELEDC
ncbi:MAG: acetoacetate--CoA ligase [Legionellaceae bacterium]|nr:acetoacetate--CoA ligase [Legionellaceae bacterium]